MQFGVVGYRATEDISSVARPCTDEVLIDVYACLMHHSKPLVICDVPGCTVSFVCECITMDCM